MKTTPDNHQFSKEENLLYFITLRDEDKNEEIDYPVTEKSYINFFERFKDLWDKRVRFYTAEGENVSGILVGLKSK